MGRVLLALCGMVALAAGLGSSTGCCCCQQGFALRGDWSLQMDSLPSDGGACCHGNCQHSQHSSMTSEVSAAPTTSPRFHSVPTAPVKDAKVPHLADMPAGPPLETGSDVRQLASVLRPEDAPGESSGSSSWMFVHGPPRHAGAMPELSQRRQLTAEAWTPTKRR